MPRWSRPVLLLFLAGLQVSSGAVLRTRLYGGNATAGTGGDMLGLHGLPTNMAVDAKGYSYLLGDYTAPDPHHMFYVDLGLVSKADVEPFALKHSPEGEVLWVTNFVVMPASSGNGTKYVASATGMALDEEGNCFISGYFNAANMSFPTSMETNVTLTNPGFSQGRYAQYVAKLDSTVGMVMWATLLSSPSGSTANADDRLPSTIVLDKTGGIAYFGGAYGPPDDDVSASGTYNLNGMPVQAHGKLDILLAQFSGETGEIAWARTYGGAGDDAIATLATAKMHDGVILLANSESAVIQLGDRVPSISTGRADGVANTVLLAVADAKGSRRSPAGNIVGATAFGGSNEFNNGKGVGLTVDNSDEVYVLGNFNGRFNVGPNGRGQPTTLQSLQADPANPSRLADTDVFLGKYSVSTRPTFKLEWVQTFGGLDQDTAGALEEGGADVYLSVFSASKTITMGLLNARQRKDAVVLENNLAGDYATTNLATVSAKNGLIATASNKLAPACTAAPGAEIDGQQTFRLDQRGYLYLWGPRYLPDVGPDAVKARTVCAEVLPVVVGGELLYHAKISTLSCEEERKCTRLTGCV